LEFQWQRRTAYNYIAVYETFGNCTNFAKLGPSVLYLLAAPSTPEEARQEALERAGQGEVITYALAKQIRFHHTIEVEAKTVKNDEETPDLHQAPPDREPLPQPEPVDECLPLTNEAQTELAPVSQFEVDDHIYTEGIQNKHYNGKTTNAIRVNSSHKTLTAPSVEGSLPQSAVSRCVQHCTKVEVPASFQFEVGDRVRILRRQHGENNWTGKTARIWQLTPDGWLRVDVEGHKGVKFTLQRNWVEPMPEVSSEQQDVQPEQVLDEEWADEPDPESPVIIEAPTEVKPEGEATPQFRAGDRLQVTNLGKSNQQWTGEVAEVVEAAEDCIKVIVEIRPA